MGRLNFSHAIAMVRLAATLALFASTGAITASAAEPASSPEARTAAALKARLGTSAPLLDFLTRMPKGGDLHHHLTGSIYAESYIDYAARDGLCIDAATMTIVDPPWRNQVIDSWSIRNFVPSPSDRSPEGHFFRAFFAFDRVTNHHWPEMFAEVAHRAGMQNVHYIETTLTPDQGAAGALGRKLGWQDDFAAMRDRLYANGMEEIIALGAKNLDLGEQGMRAREGCDTPNPKPACSVTLRFQYQILRALSREDVFAQMVAAFALAAKDSRVVAVNPVMPMDDFTALRDFDLQLRMIDFLHRLYPTVHLSLHAGELSAGQVPPEELYDHIRQSIRIGHAERIGHGQDVIYETDAPGLLKEMADKHIAVESTLTTERIAGGIPDRDHPLNVYRLANVPVVLSTDDEGVARTQMTWEFRVAAEIFNVDYIGLKRMVRDSLDYAFLPGDSLWKAPEKYRGIYIIAGPCAGQSPARPAQGACRAHLAAHEKARMEWAEEAAFARFEQSF
jgi:adenosine deaminase